MNPVGTSWYTRSPKQHASACLACRRCGAGAGGIPQPEPLIAVQEPGGGADCSAQPQSLITVQEKGGKCRVCSCLLAGDLQAGPPPLMEGAGAHWGAVRCPQGDL